MIPPERYLGSKWLPETFTISLLPKYEEPRYEENKTVPKISRERARHCHLPDTYCVPTTSRTSLCLVIPQLPATYDSPKPRFREVNEWQSWDLNPGLCASKVLAVCGPLHHSTWLPPWARNVAEKGMKGRIKVLGNSLGECRELERQLEIGSWLRKYMLLR